MLVNIKKNAEIIVDCENKNKLYVQVGKRRLIFIGGKCVGWYKP